MVIDRRYNSCDSARHIAAFIKSESAAYIG